MEYEYLHTTKCSCPTKTGNVILSFGTQSSSAIKTKPETCKLCEGVIEYISTEKRYIDLIDSKTKIVKKEIIDAETT